MRGKRPLTEFNNAQIRIIPAHAGQTVRRAHVWNAATDHPRACGANVLPCVSSSRMAGSSPRMRGKHNVVGYVGRAVRIIPAHAGQTLREMLSSFHTTDHPRACGANDA